MSIFSPPERPPAAFQVHRQLKGPKETKRDLPSRDVTSEQTYMQPTQPPVASANTGKSNKFTARSPLVTTMGSSIKGKKNG